jgi:hypothetical protein
MDKRIKSVTTAREWIGAILRLVIGLIIAAAVGLMFAYWLAQTQRPTATVGQWISIIAVMLFFVFVGLLLIANATRRLVRALSPRSLHIDSSALSLYRGDKLIGQIPFANMLGAELMNRDTKTFAWRDSFLDNLTRDVSRLRLESVGVAVWIDVPNDPDTFWPGRFMQRGKARIEIQGSWEISHRGLESKLQAELLRFQQYHATDLRAARQRTPQPAAKRSPPGPHQIDSKNSTLEIVLAGAMLASGPAIVVLPFFFFQAGLGKVMSGVGLPPGQLVLGGIAFLIALVGGLILIVSGALTLRPTILTDTLEMDSEFLTLRRGERLLGQVPFTNVKRVDFKTVGMADQVEVVRSLAGLLSGGVLGAIRHTFTLDPGTSIGVILELKDADDPDTFWPRSFLEPNKLKIAIDGNWQVSHAGLVHRIEQRILREQNTQGFRWD